MPRRGLGNGREGVENWMNQSESRKFTCESWEFTFAKLNTTHLKSICGFHEGIRNHTELILIHKFVFFFGGERVERRGIKALNDCMCVIFWIIESVINM